MAPDRPLNRTAGQKVILLVKDAERICEALRIGRVMIDAGASVTLILLGAAAADRQRHASLAEEASAPASRSGAGLSLAVCSVGHPLPARTPLAFLSFEQLAGKLKTADLVIPF